MGFEIYRIEPMDGGRWQLRKVGPLPLGGANGIFATHLPALAASAPEWSLEPATLLEWAGIAEPATHGVFFNLTPSKPEQLNLLQLEGARGRTVSLWTDVVLRFKVAAASREGARFSDGKEGWVLPGWSGNAEHFEHLRMAGGTKGGTWAWSEPPHATSATVV